MAGRGACVSVYGGAFGILSIQFDSSTNVAFHFCLVRGPSAGLSEARKKKYVYALHFGWRKRKENRVEVKPSKCFIVLRRCAIIWVFGSRG